MNCYARLKVESSKKLKTTTLNMGSRQYFLGRLIGEGTYSKVCIAFIKERGDQLQQQVACKIIKKRHVGVEFTNRFLPREIQILHTICHPNIVTVADIIQVHSTVYIFMTYCRYGDLLNYVKNRGALGERRTKYLYRQIVSAIDYLHNMEIAHRDLKCENIFLNGRHSIKIGDFGFARLCRNEKTGARLLSRTFCGSPAYAAPEIIQGLPYNPKMYDIWSIGCILYIMLTARMPFDESNVRQMLKLQLNRDICLSMCCDTRFSLEVRKLLFNLLEPDATRRFTIQQLVKSDWLKMN